MRPRHLCFLALVAAACGQPTQPASVAVAPSLVFPRDLLGEISAIHLQVFDTASGVACSTSTAAMTGVPTGPSPLPNALAATDLGTSGCTTPGAKFCGTLPLTESKTPLVFAAVGKGSAGNVVANGCTSTLVNQEAVTVPITMVRFIPPAVCGDGIVEVGETCDPGTGSDPLCKTCQTSEIQLSPVSSYPGGPSAPAPAERGNPFLLWPSAMSDAGYLFAFFSDRTGSPSRQQVSMSVLGDLLAPVTDLGLAVQGGASLFLPDDPNTFPPQPQADDQSHPSAAVVGGTYFVVFEDDNTMPPNGIDVHLRSMDGSLNANEGPGGACGVNGPTGMGEAGVQSDPRVAAGPGGVLFVVWQDESMQTVSGVTYTPPTPPQGCGTLGTQQLLGSGSSPAIAATSSGWVVAWQSGADVKWQSLRADGSPIGAAQLVGSHSGQQSLPAVATSSDGSFAVAWSAPASSGTSAIFAQRFDATQSPLAGDQTSPVNNLTAGAETSPAVAYTAAAGGAYVVAWVDSASPNQVRARLLASAGGSLGDGSGYLFNTIDGQINEFPVSTTAGRARANPTVVVGGSGPTIAFGWEDQSPASGAYQPGIIGRRFPPPSQ